MWRNTKTAGFSLIEMLITIGVLSVVLGIAMYALSPAKNLSDANEQKESVEINQLEARVRDWQIGGGVIQGLTDQWRPICRYKETPGPNDPTCVALDSLQDDDYVEVIPYRLHSVSPYTGYEARAIDGIFEARRMFWPREIPGLLLWLDAADSSTITLGPAGNDCSTGCVKNWRDKSENPVTGVSIPLAPYNFDRRPHNDGSINGVPALQFLDYPREDYMVLGKPSKLNLLSSTHDATLMIVAQQYDHQGQFLTKGSQFSFSYAAPDLHPHRFTWKVEKGTGLVSTWLDDTQVASGAPVSATPCNADVLISGRRSACNGSTIVSSSAFMNAQIGEIILYNRVLNANEQTRIDEYLKEKWSL